MLYFFTLNTAPLGVIEKHVKLLNLWFVYVRENECCNKWANVFVIVSNYTRCNNSGKVEPVCGPCTLTRQRPQDIHAPYRGPRKNKQKKQLDCVSEGNKTPELWFQLCLFVSNGTYQQLHNGRTICSDKEVLCCISSTFVFYWFKDTPTLLFLICWAVCVNYRYGCVCVCACLYKCFIQAVKIVMLWEKYIH